MIRRAFTLVELLVVVVIISMLAALLVPAVQSARGRARIAQCQNNQHNISLAIMQFDSAKRHLPGVLNSITAKHTPPATGSGIATVVGWPPVLFEYIGRHELWEDIDSNTRGWRYGRDATTADGDGINPTPRLDVLVCPSDNDMTVDCPLSYVVNIGGYDVCPNNTHNQNGETGVPVVAGLFVDRTSGGQSKSISSIKSPAQTVMLGEKIITLTSNPGDFVPAIQPVGRQWTDANALSLGFSWPNFPTFDTTLQRDCFEQSMIGQFEIKPLAPTVKYWAPLPSVHPGISIVTFADGHTESISSECLCSVYKATP